MLSLNPANVIRELDILLEIVLKARVRRVVVDGRVEQSLRRIDRDVAVRGIRAGDGQCRCRGCRCYHRKIYPVSYPPKAESIADHWADCCGYLAGCHSRARW